METNNNHKKDEECTGRIAPGALPEFFEFSFAKRHGRRFSYFKGEMRFVSSERKLLFKLFPIVPHVL